MFERKPFRLTPHGRLLQAEIAPFFDRLPGLGERLRRLSASTVAVAFSGTIAIGFRPATAAALRAALPDGERTFFTGRSDDLETWLREDRVQFVVMAVSARPRAGVRCEILGHAPLGLLVPRRMGPVASGWFWQQERITEPLIAPPGDDPVARTFAQGLQALRVDWPVRLRIDSTEAALQLVADGQGVAVVPVLSPRSIPSGVRLLPLPGFGRIPFAALWRPPAGPVLECLLAAVRDTARKLWPAGTLPAYLLTGLWIRLADGFFAQVGVFAWE